MLKDIQTIIRWNDLAVVDGTVADGTDLFGLIIKRGTASIFEPMDREWIYGNASLEAWEVGQILGGN